MATEKPTNQRPNYFAGQYLLDDDFRLEQDYHIDRQRWHHHLLHISGIAEGLKVNKGEGNLVVNVSEGSAIDSQGRQIILLDSQKVDLIKSYSSSNASIPDGTYTLYIGYSEQKTDQQAAGEENTSRRWQEEPEFNLSSAGLTDFIPLAKLTINSNAVSDNIDNSVRFYSGLRLPSPDGEMTLRSKSDGTQSLAELKGSLSIAGTLSVTGNVGIGTTNPPTEKLEISGGNLKVSGNISATKLKISNSALDFADISFNGSGMGQLQMVGWSSGWNINAMTNGKHLYLNRDSGDSSNVYIGRNGKELFVRGTDGNVGIGTTNPTAAKLQVQIDGATTAASLKLEHNGSNLIVRPLSAGGKSSVIENTGGGYLIINPNGGNVGIGTTSPSRTLSIKADFSDTADAQQLLIQGSTNPNYQLLLGYHTANNYGSIQAMNQTVGVRPLVLNPAGGNVGIGTTSPGAKLSISASDNHLQLRREKTETTGGKLLFLELYQDDSTPTVPEIFPNIRFHHFNRYWHRIEARGNGLHFKNGSLDNDNYIGIYAANVASCVETLQMIRGTVQADGTVSVGRGFTVVRDSTGLYTITFSSAFSAEPTVVATQQYPNHNDFNLTSGDTKDNAIVVGVSTTKCLIKCGRADGIADDRRFHFIAIGSR